MSALSEPKLYGESETSSRPAIREYWGKYWWGYPLPAIGGMVRGRCRDARPAPRQSPADADGELVGLLARHLVADELRRQSGGLWGLRRDTSRIGECGLRAWSRAEIRRCSRSAKAPAWTANRHRVRRICRGCARDGERGTCSHGEAAAVRERGLAVTADRLLRVSGGKFGAAFGRAITFRRTRAVPERSMSMSRAAACERSMMRPCANGPRSLMRTSTRFPFERLVTSTQVWKGSLRCAAVSFSMS